MAQLQNLVRAGTEAYERSSLFRDLYDVFNFPPFQRLSAQMKDQQVAETVRMFFELYQDVEEEYARLSPIERLGVLDAIIADPETRQAAVRVWKRNHVPAIAPPPRLGGP